MRKRSSGMSTILGTLIFICIVFTCFIPLWFTKMQADSLYNEAIAKMMQADLDRSMESLEISTVNATIFLKNTGSTSLNIIRIWFNDTYEEINVTLPMFGKSELEFPHLNGKYNVMVVTDRGRIFTAEMNHIILIPTTIVSPGSGIKNDLVTIKGYGFGYEVNVDTIKFAGSSLMTNPRVPVTDGVGSWEATFNVPDKMDGEYDITVEDEVGNTASILFRVGK